MYRLCHVSLSTAVALGSAAIGVASGSLPQPPQSAPEASGDECRIRQEFGRFGMPPHAPTPAHCSRIRDTVISPGVTESELADSISDPEARAGMDEFRKIAITPDAVARAILFAVEQPAGVDVSEIIVRPTASPY